MLFQHSASYLILILKYMPIIFVYMNIDLLIQVDMKKEKLIHLGNEWIQRLYLMSINLLNQKDRLS